MSGIFEDIKNSFNKGNNAVRKLIIINVAAFILTTILKRLPVPFFQEFVQSLALPHLFTDFILQPWSLFSYMFLHAGIFHILSNMLFLYFIGNILRDFVGNKHIYKAFIWGGITGGILFLIFFNLIPGFTTPIKSFMVGASGGVTSIIVAAAVFAPDYEIRLFGIISIKLKWIALFRVLSDLLFLGDGNNDGGQLAHLGGAAFGYLYVKAMRGSISFPNVSGLFNVFKKKPKPDRKFNVYVNDTKSSKNSNANQQDIDVILDKISKSGYDSLTVKEKDILFKASKEL